MNDKKKEIKNKTNVSRSKQKFVTNLTKDNQGGLLRNEEENGWKDGCVSV